MSNKKSPKNKIEKSLINLVLIIIVLVSVLVGSIVYENNKITCKVTGLEKVSGF